MVKKLKETDLDSQFEALLRGLAARAPFLKLESLTRNARLGQSGQHRADWLARVRAGSRRYALVAESKRLGQPREVRAAVLQLELCLADLPKPRYGLLLAPFISEESARICAEAGIGYADLAGNARLSFDQVFIETRSAGNPFYEKRESHSLFAPRATRVVRTLLQGPLRPWKVTALAESARVSLGWVSAVRQQLLAREWAREETDGLRITKPDAVLDAWARVDDWSKRTQTREYSVLENDPVRLAEQLQNALKTDPPVFTQWLAGWLRRPYTNPVVVTAYVKTFPSNSDIEKALLARQVDSGGALRLVMPKDDGALYPSQTVRGFPLVSDVQIYLDLLRAGLRGDEQASELRNSPDFSGGWK